MTLTTTSEVRISQRAVDRWNRGHPWIFSSDVKREQGAAGVAVVTGPEGKFAGWALYSPASEIRLRLLDRRPNITIDRAWLHDRIMSAFLRRSEIDANAFRVVHAEADWLPSLIVDRYDQWAVVQILSAGLETMTDAIVETVAAVLRSRGILLRNDAAVRRREGLPLEVKVASGDVPDEITIREGAIKYLVSPRTGQKTGAFLDQRDNRLVAAAFMRPGGRALDCFSFHGSFALHLAGKASEVVALDVSEEALARGARNATLNGFRNIQWMVGDAFDALRELDRGGASFDLVVVDPPAFAKSKAVIPQALKGYKDINLRAMRLVSPGGYLVTASCSFHVRWPDFLSVLAAAAADSRRAVTMVRHLTQAIDHPEIVTVPETGYLKGAVLRID